MSDGKQTKAQFKERLKNMSFTDLTQELHDVSLEIMKTKSMSGVGVNPYEKGKYNPKILHWKKSLLTEKLLRRSQ